MYRYWICDTQTGAKILEVFPFSGSGERKLNGAGASSHVFSITDDGLDRAGRRHIFAYWKRTLVVEVAGFPVYAGLIVKTEYTRNGRLRVHHAELRTILTRRFLFGIGGYAAGTHSMVAQSLRGIIYQLFILGVKGNYSPVWDLPVVIPDTGEAGGFDRTYFNYLFANIESAISELQDMEGGPDIDLNPRWNSSGRLEWELRVGSATIPQLGGQAFEFNVTSPTPDVFDVGVVEDGSAMVTGVFVIANGIEEDMVHGEAATVAVAGGVPSLDVTRQYKDIDDVPTADAHARAERDTYSVPTEQWSFDAIASEVLPGLVPGSPIKLWWKGDPWVEDGWHHMRCIGYTVDGSNTVTIDVQETR